MKITIFHYLPPRDETGGDYADFVLDELHGLVSELEFFALKLAPGEADPLNPKPWQTSSFAEIDLWGNAVERRLHDLYHEHITLVHSVWDRVASLCNNLRLREPRGDWDALRSRIHTRIRDSLRVRNAHVHGGRFAVGLSDGAGFWPIADVLLDAKRHPDFEQIVAKISGLAEAFCEEVLEESRAVLAILEEFLAHVQSHS